MIPNTEHTDKQGFSSSKSFLITIGAFLFITGLTSTVIFLARGYTFDFKKGTVSKTGIMVVTSEPRDAAVYLDGKLRDTTNTTLNFLTPGKYTLRVTKDGFTPWEKEVEVKAELVTRLDLTLFPQVPDLRRLTFSGVKQAWLTPDGLRIIYEVTESTKKGLWVMGNGDRLPFINSDPIQIYKDLGKIDLAKAIIVPSPDSKTVLIVDTATPQHTYYLLDLERVNEDPQPQPLEVVQPQLVNWHDSLLAKEKEQRERLIRSVRDIPAHESTNPDLTPVLQAIDNRIAQATLPAASPVPAVSPSRNRVAPSPSAAPSPTQDTIAKILFLSQNNMWSPKQNKVIFSANDQMKVYDVTTGKFYNIPGAQSISWFPTNLHLIFINPSGKQGEIVITDFDGKNPVSIFSGAFVDNVAFPWNTGTRVVMLTNLNQSAGTEPNLYAINLR